MKRKSEEISTLVDSTGTINDRCNSDVYSRASTTNKKGRGSLTGWTTCPLCNNNGNSNDSSSSISSSNVSSTTRNTRNTKNQKKFSIGRGIAMHLQQVHTPWKPGKAELARRERIRRRLRGLVYSMYRGNKTKHHDHGGFIHSNNMDIGMDIHMDDKLPKIKSGEVEEEYYKRVLQYRLGKVWDRSKKNNNVCWDPTEEDIREWNEKMMELTRQVERDTSTNTNTSTSTACNESRSTPGSGSSSESCAKLQRGVSNSNSTSNFIQPGLDRNGIQAREYKDSLPPFIKAASEGNLAFLKKCIEKCRRDDGDNGNKDGNDNDNDNYEKIRAILKIRDRNGSVAEHWAAGGGHLECLKYLFDLRANYLHTSIVQAQPFRKDCLLKGTTISTYDNTNTNNNTNTNEKKKRKRDGKTCLHYAARNGHNDIIEYLLTIKNNCRDDPVNTHEHEHEYEYHDIDMASNDGTTPLHLACYGGNLSTVKLLILNHGADVFKANEWGCGTGHWAAMTVQKDTDQTIGCLDFIRKCVLDRNNNNNSYATIGYEENGGSAHNHNQGTSNNDAEEKKYKESHCEETNRGKVTTFNLFGLPQKQGHSAVHKAAQKLNRSVIEWLAQEAKERWTSSETEAAGREDAGGNKPSDIWCAMGGDKQFKEWMRSFGW